MIAFLWSVLSNIAATLILKPFSFIFSRWQQDDIIERWHSYVDDYLAETAQPPQ